MNQRPFSEPPSPYANNGGRPRQYDIQPWRRWAYYGGAVLQGAGILVFLGFFSSSYGVFNRVHAGDETAFTAVPHMFSTFPLAILGLLIYGASQMLRSVGRKGLAGSGLLLSPTREARDAEPWSRSKGARRNFEVEEMTALRDITGASGAAPRQEVRIRCRSCGYLETEDATFCSACGQRV